MTPRTPEQEPRTLHLDRKLGGLPQLIRYVSTYPQPADLLRTLQAGVLGRRGMSAAFLWSLADGARLTRLASIDWPREVAERYAILPLELHVPAVQAVLQDRHQIDDTAGFGSTYLTALDDEFLTPRFDELRATSAINAPLRHAGSVVGALGFVTTEPWVDDEESRALLDGLSALVGMWMSHPRSGARDTSSSPGQRDWSLDFTTRQRQVLRMAGEGKSNSDIARALLISTSSVKQDLQLAMRALRSHDRATAHERALQLGLLD